MAEQGRSLEGTGAPGGSSSRGAEASPGRRPTETGRLSLTPRARVLLAIGVMLVWVFVRDWMVRMDDVFFQPSWSGVKGLALYAVGDYAGAARAYRQHFREVVLPTASADGALLAGNPDLAEQIARKNLEETPDAVGPLLTLGEVALERSAFEQAIGFFKQALEREPDHVDALLLSSVAHARAGTYGEAIDALNRALRQNSVGSRLTILLKILETTGELARRPGRDRPSCLLAHYHRYLRVFDPSNGRIGIAYANQAITAGDRPADAYLTIGVVYDKEGRRDKALAAFQKAIEIDPRHADAYRWAAFVYSERGDLANEYRMIRAAFEVAPADPFYIDHLDHVLMEKLGDPHQLVAVMEKALEFNSENVRAHERLGYAYGFLGDQGRSIAHYERAIRLEPSNPRLHEGLGWALNRLERTEEAIAAYQRAGSLAPTRYWPHSALAATYHRARRYREAITEYETALRLGEPDVGEHASLCAVYHAVSEFQRAVDCFRVVLSRDPQNPLANRLLPESLNNARRQQAPR